MSSDNRAAPLRPINPAGFTGLAERAGVPPMLQWIEIARMRVDDSYQRQIGRKGQMAIRAIAKNFQWSKFSPVVLAPIEGDLFAIIDGQHRATAAAACGIEKVPALVVLVDRAGQADAFAGINGNSTRVQPMALHRAAAAAGQPEAVRVDRVARAAGVKVLPYPIQILKQGPGETMAVSAISAMIALIGEADATRVLAAIVKAGGGKPGILISPIMLGCALLFSRQAARGVAPEVIAEGLAQSRLLHEFGRAEMGAKELGKPVKDVLATRLDAAISKRAAA